MKSIEFHTIAEKTPPDGQDIWYVYFSRFYGTQEILYGKVEYQWEVQDANGDPTGDTYFEDPKSILIDGETAVLLICVDGEVVTPETYWTMPESFDTLLPSDW